jgi:hypothetical protein
MMSLGPVSIQVSLEEGSDRQEALEVLADLRKQITSLEKGSDTRMLIAMIIGSLGGLIE